MKRNDIKLSIRTKTIIYAYDTGSRPEGPAEEGAQ